MAMIVPIMDRLRKVNMQIVTMAVPAQEGITRDNVTVKVDAVVYFRVVDPVRAIVSVEDYPFGLQLIASNTSDRSFVLPRRAVEEPDRYLSDLVVASYRKERAKGEG